MIPNYDKIKRYLYIHQDRKCPVCKKIMLYNEKLDLHHRVNNSKWRRKKYPLFINSLLNLVLLHNTCHLKMGRFLQLTDYRANKIELFLQKHKKIAEWVNNP